MIRFLKRVKPRFIASIHQPFGVVARSDKNMAYTRRLSNQLGLPIRRVDIGPCHGPVHREARPVELGSMEATE